MKNLRILKDCQFLNTTIKAGHNLENVPNDIAAALVAKGEAVEVSAKYEVLGKRDPVIENRDPKPSK